MKRFYRDATAGEQDGGFVVLLDGRPVRTPAKALLSTASRALADAVAGEWAAQGEKIDPKSMPLMRHACTALDRVVPQHQAVADEVANYGATDLLCYRASEPDALVRLQDESWQPLLDWLAESHGVRLQTTTGVMPVVQDAAGQTRLRKVIGAHDAFELTALHTAVTVSGSLVIGLALSAGQIDADEGWRLSRVDHAFQAERWGVDPEAEKAAAAAQADLTSAAYFLHLLRG